MPERWWRRFGTIRRQLIVWYLSVLAFLLIALGISQSATLTSYLHNTTAQSEREAAYAGLHLLGPCFITSTADLKRNALVLAQFMGSRDTAVKIVTPRGRTLADHESGLPGHTTPLRLSAATIHTLIALARPPRSVPAYSCNDRNRPVGVERASGAEPRSITVAGVVLVAVPLGLGSKPYGYALLGRSSGPADDIIRRSVLVFALGALIALLIAGIVALPLINRALRPLQRIADTATAIAAGDLEQRTHLTHSADEIGRLGSAFDTMVDRLQSALTSATDSEERMRRFLADASHELRTPLTVLRGMSEVLLRRRGELEPEIGDALGDLHEEAVRLSRLVDDLLTLTRLDTGQLPTREHVPVSEFLCHLVDRYGTAWPGRAIELTLGPVDGAAAEVDPEALRRMLTNLIDNAARYSTTGKPIELSAAAGADTVTVTVRDQGPGMNPDDAARVFERFFRGAPSRARQTGGTGLGLSIVRALAEQNGGRVELETAPERGTAVSIVLPASPAPEPEDVEPDLPISDPAQP